MIMKKEEHKLSRLLLNIVKLKSMANIKLMVGNLSQHSNIPVMEILSDALIQILKIKFLINI